MGATEYVSYFYTRTEAKPDSELLCFFNQNDEMENVQEACQINNLALILTITCYSLLKISALM